MQFSKPIIVLGIHGLGGHSGWFKNFADELEKYGIEFKAYDLPGFGQNHVLGKTKSQHIKGHVDSFQEWIDFVEARYEEIKQEYPAHKVVIMGHSLGAVISSCLARIHEGDLLVLSVPGFKGASSTFDPMFTIATLKKIFIDKMIMGNDVFVEMPVSQKSKQTPAYTDPLRVGTVTQTLLFEVLKMGEKAKQEIRKKRCPVFFIQVDNDAVVDNATQDSIFEKLNATHKIKRSYVGADHDWIWDQQFTKLITSDLVEWFARL